MSLTAKQVRSIHAHTVRPPRPDPPFAPPAPVRFEDPTALEAVVRLCARALVVWAPHPHPAEADAAWAAVALYSPVFACTPSGSVHICFYDEGRKVMDHLYGGFMPVLFVPGQHLTLMDD